MPFAPPRLVVDRDKALGKQVVARAQAAVEIRARRLDRQIGEPELLVGGHLVPDADVAVDRPRFIQPRVVAEFAGTRDGVEGPQAFPGPHVEPADEPLGVVVSPRSAALEERRADQHDAVARDRRRGMQSDLAFREIDLHAFADHHAFLQIDDAVLAERRDAGAGLRVEGDELIAGRDVEDALIPAVGPVRHTAPRQLAGRIGGARALGLRVHPLQLTRRRVERDDRPPCAGRRVQHAADHQRCAFELVLGTWSEAVGLEAPGDLERREVAGVDLVERRIMLVPQVAGIRPPLAARRRRRVLRRDSSGCPDRDGRGKHGQRRSKRAVCHE